MQKFNFAIHIWMLRLSGVIEGSWSLKPDEEQLANGAVDESLGFRSLWAQSKKGRLEGKDWEEFGKIFTRLYSEVIQRADIIAATPAVVASEALKPKVFHDVINDETSVTTALETLTSWRSTETLMLIGDHLQLNPPVFTGEAENPFYRIMQTSTFARFRELNFPAFLLNEQMRMPAGMMHMSNEIIYSGKLKDGRGTALHDNSEARSLKDYMTKVYPTIQAEPDNLIYPVMLNVNGESNVESKSSSVANGYNVINDETSVTTALQTFMARSTETLILIGDSLLLNPHRYLHTLYILYIIYNPFYRSMQNSTFARLRDLHFPAFLLHEQMRMPQGMMHLSNDIVYDKKLSDGSNTMLKDHHDAQALKEYLHKMYPSMDKEPADLIYPVMLNVHGESQIEAGSLSVCNHYHVAATIGEIVKLIKGHPNATPANIGIATPYRAQIRLYHRALQSAHKQLPKLKLFDANFSVIRVGTAEHWQGKEIPYVFVDLVRASNDAGNLGFVSHARRLNVLITRQQIGLWIVADESCVLTLDRQAQIDNPDDDFISSTDKSKEDKKDVKVIAVFQWMRDNGRVVNIDKGSLTEDFVEFPKLKDDNADAGT